MPPPTSTRPDPALWMILALAFGLRIGLLALYPHIEGHGDESLHYAVGVLLRHLGHGVISFWAPGYDALLAGVFAVSIPEPVAAKAVQTLISTATVGLVYGLARRAGGRRAARIAGALCALYPSLVAFSHYLYNETLFIGLLTGAAYVTFRSGALPSRREQLVAGALFGLAILTRSVLFFFLPLWLIWSLVCGRRAEAKCVAVVLATAIAVVAPWTIRNALHHGTFMLVDPTLSSTAYLAFNTHTLNRDLGFLSEEKPAADRPACPAEILAGREPLPPVEVLELFFPARAAHFAHRDGGLRQRIAIVRGNAVRDFSELQRCELAAALDFARREPLTLLAHMPRRLYAFWGPNSFLLRGVAKGQYPHGLLRESHYGALKWVVVTSFGLVVAAWILALGRRRAPPLVAWISLLAVYYTAMHVLAVAYSRYRLPLMPFLIVVASLWLAQPAWPQGRTRALLVCGLLAAAAASMGHYVFAHLP